MRPAHKPAALRSVPVQGSQPPVPDGRCVRLPALILLSLTAISFAPLVCVVLATGVAGALGCRLDEAGIYPCPVLGLDLGSPLAVAAMMGWFMLLTWPGMLAALLGWLVWVVISLRRRAAARAP